MIENLWAMLAEGQFADIARALGPIAVWDDPLFGRAEGAKTEEAMARFADWLRGRLAPASIQHLRTTRQGPRVVVEHVLPLSDGLVWNPASLKAEKAARFELATATVADPSGLRVYFSTWSVLDGKSRMRVGPICPDERGATRAAMDAMPVVRQYFDGLAAGDPGMIELFEPDGYFREPANNYACGRDQLVVHFQHILELGGVGIEFLTATREGERLGLELQTVTWGTKKMPQPQAGFACYELGPHGKLQGARVYDSVVPPEF